jgi:anti-sigma B factor antagonist
MEITAKIEGDVAVVELAIEELDAGNVEQFKHDLAPVLEAHAKVVLDLEQLRFLDSSGLGAFLSCLRKLNAKSGDLKLCGMSKQIHEVFHLVRMHRIFDIFNTREEAVSAFQRADSKATYGPPLSRSESSV